jgi:hypothetical protein
VLPSEIVVVRFDPTGGTSTEVDSRILVDLAYRAIPPARSSGHVTGQPRRGSAHLGDHPPRLPTWHGIEVVPRDGPHGSHRGEPAVFAPRSAVVGPDGGASSPPQTASFFRTSACYWSILADRESAPADIIAPAGTRPGHPPRREPSAETVERSSCGANRDLGSPFLGGLGRRPVRRALR